MSDLLRVEGSTLKVTLHPGQVQAWDSKKRFTFVIAGTQGGKTSFEPLWLDREIKNSGRGDYLAVTATYDLFKLKFLPEMISFFVETFGWSYSASDRVIWKSDGPRLFTRIILRSASADGGLESTTAKAAILDECGQDGFRLGAWEAILRRLSLSGGRVLGGTTPYNLGWLKTEIFDRWRKGDPDIQVVQFKSIMNPSFPRAEYLRAKRTMPGWKFEMFYNGNFSRPAGMIYEDYSDANTIAPFDIPRDWPRYLGVDFGAIHTAKIFGAIDPRSGVLYVYNEALEGSMTTKEQVASVRRTEPMVIHGVWGGAGSEQQQRWDWTDAGLTIQKPPISEVEAGIDRITARLKEKRIFIFNTLKGLADEFVTYSRKLTENGEPTEEIKDKNDFHRLDALRYLVAGIDGGAVTVVSGSSPFKRKK